MHLLHVPNGFLFLAGSEGRVLRKCHDRLIDALSGAKIERRAAVSWSLEVPRQMALVADGIAASGIEFGEIDDGVALRARNPGCVKVDVFFSRAVTFLTSNRVSIRLKWWLLKLIFTIANKICTP